MDRGVCPTLLAVEGIPFSTTHHVQARGRWGPISLHCYSSLCSKLGIITSWWWGAEASLLYEQVLTWSRGLVPTIGKRPYWQWFTLHVNFPITSRFTRWWCWLNFLFNPYFVELITQEGLPNRVRFWGLSISNICLAPLLRAKSLRIWWPSLLNLHWKKRDKSRTWMENQLEWSPYKNLYLGGCMSMVLLIKEDLGWD